MLKSASPEVAYFLLKQAYPLSLLGNLGKKVMTGLGHLGEGRILGAPLRGLKHYVTGGLPMGRQLTTPAQVKAMEEMMARRLGVIGAGAGAGAGAGVLGAAYLGNQALRGGGAETPAVAPVDA